MVGAAVLLATGCGPTTDRLKLSGEVLLDGAPLDKGTVRFTGSVDGNKYSTGATIREGAFSIPRDNGLPPGTFNVEISSPDTDGPPQMIHGTPVARERIPASFNVESTETIDVTADGDNRFVFDIPSQTGS